MTANRLTVLASNIRAAHEAAQHSARDTLERVLECGRLLLEARAQVAGPWSYWVAKHLPFGLRQAEKYVRAARHEKQIREANSKSGLSPSARFNLAKVLASVAVPQVESDAPEGDRTTSTKPKRSPGSKTPLRLEDLLRKLAALELDPAEVAKDTRDPAALKAVVHPAYDRLRLLNNALDKRLAGDGKRPAAAPQPPPFEFESKWRFG
jgi:hypothetical protein